MHAVDWIDEMENTLADAVEVKNRESLHRYVVQVAHRFGETNEDLRVIPSMQQDIKEIRADIRDIKGAMGEMKDEFRSVTSEIKEDILIISGDIRAMNARMDASDKRFEDTNKRFNGMQALIALGFTVLATMMTLIRLFG